MTTAPDFTGEYPSRGELIGPAWQLAWDLLDGQTEMDSGTLATIMSTKTGIQEVTAKNLLRSARKAGHLTVRYRTVRKRRQATYRRVH